MKLLVVGFNARPIAKSAKSAGHDIGVIDYFGDLDLASLTNNCFSVLRQKPAKTLHRPLHRRPAEYLFHLAQIMIEEQNDFDGIILGSAFDRYPELIEKFQQLKVRLYANGPDEFRKIREIIEVQKLAKKAGFLTPKTIKVNNKAELLEVAKDWEYPLVTRSGGGGGGSGIKLWTSYIELQEKFNEIEELDGYNKTTYFLQEFIKGLDASASVISTKQELKIVSINEQLIGDKNFNAPGDFSYCGNIVPLSTKKNQLTNEFLGELNEKIRIFFLKTNLKGTNGMDFVIKDNKIYFMEVNPRFQGSIECIEYATGINIVKHHISAFNNNTIALPNNPKYHRKAIKTILFSKSEKLFAINKYPKSKWIVDRTHPGVLIEDKDPICSIVMPIKNVEYGYLKAKELAQKIIHLNQK